MCNAKRKLYATFPESTKGVGREKKSGHCESSSQFLMILKELHPDKILLFRIMENCPPSPPLSQHFALSEQQVLMLA